MSEKRLSLLTNGNVRYELETPYRDGTTHLLMTPLEFLQRLAALVPGAANPETDIANRAGDLPAASLRARMS